MSIDHHPGEAHAVEFPDGRAWRRITTTAEAMREDAGIDTGANLDAARAARTARTNRCRSWARG